MKQQKQRTQSFKKIQSIGKRPFESKQPSVTRPSVNRPPVTRPSVSRPSVARPSVARPSIARPSTNKVKTIHEKLQPHKYVQKTDIKRNGNEHKHNNKAVSSKQKWLQILNDPKSKILLNKVWTSKDPVRSYQDTIAKLSEKIK